MFAPLAEMAAPLTRSMSVWLPVPSAVAASSTASGDVSLIVTCEASSPERVCFGFIGRRPTKRFSTVTSTARILFALASACS